MTGGITRLASMEFSIISSSANFWSKLSKGELTYGRGSASGGKTNASLTRWGWGWAVSILVGQHFINNTCLTNKCESQVFPLNKGIRVYKKTLKWNNLSKTIGRSSDLDLFPSSSSIIMWGVQAAHNPEHGWYISFTLCRGGASLPMSRDSLLARVS